MRLLAIDPGPEQSALVVLVDGAPVWAEILPNLDALRFVKEGVYDAVAIEMIASFGMPVGAEVFNTCVWVGRFTEAAKFDPTYIYRKDVKLHLCQSPRANDATIRQAIIDRFGPGKEKAIGTKKAPGPLYSLKADLWSATAVGLTYLDSHTK